MGLLEQSRRSIFTFLRTRWYATTWRYREPIPTGRRLRAEMYVLSRKFAHRVLISYFSGRVAQIPRGRSYAGNDPKRDVIMRINHSDKRQPLLLILLPQNCPDFGSQLINQIIIIVIFVLPQHGFLNHVSSEQTLKAPCTVTPRCRNKVQ